MVFLESVPDQDRFSSFSAILNAYHELFERVFHPYRIRVPCASKIFLVSRVAS
jgi:hypothetical protein